MAGSPGQEADDAPDRPDLPGAAGPLELAVPLDGDAGCIAEARHTAARFLTLAREQDKVPVAERTVEVVQLIVSELVTNAVKHAPGSALLRLRIDEGTVRVEVWDGDPRGPAVHDPDPQRIGQHGLEIVSLLARTLSVQPTPVGKRVTAVLDLDPCTSAV
ncbi:ATP-binding protein [Streptomyces sp. NPDC002564]|uniref:ATP-binding protein n=1 Tax=Streptomyces sp. NPDC002564 TaxID=3364649 RepID=UPI00369BB3F5